MARTDVLPQGSELRLTLDRYQEVMRLPEAAFNGLYKNGDDTHFLYSAIWLQTDRDAMAQAIGEGEEMREHELGYYLAPVYKEETIPFTFPLVLDKKLLIKVGKQTIDNILLNADISDQFGHTPIVDPVVLLVATTVTDPTEIIVTYPGEDVRIHPSKVTISGGVATIKIPRSRLVDPTLDLNDFSTQLAYDLDSNFIQEVDVKRLWYDEALGAQFNWYGTASSSVITDYYQTAYPKVTDNRLSIVELYPATYDAVADQWTRVTFAKCWYPPTVTVRYLSGRQANITTEIETAKLAHTLFSKIIPDRVNLCLNMWKNDQQINPNKIVTPYGDQIGALRAWMSDSRAKIGVGGKFPSMNLRR